MKMKYNLENRLINFSVDIISMINHVDKNKAGNHLSGQIVRSGTSVSLNYGEAQSAESDKDFIHKMKIILKELRETYVCLKILLKSKLVEGVNLDLIMIENNELISIFVSSIKTINQRLLSSKVK
jgi:four helix bundle protein